MTRQSAQEQNSAEPQSEEPGVPLGLQAARIVALTDCAQAYARGASRQRESAAQSRAQARGLLQSAAQALDDLRTMDDGQLAAMAVNSIVNAALFQPRISASLPDDVAANDLSEPLDIEIAVRVIQEAVQRREVGAILCNTLLKACFHLSQENISALLDVLPQPNAPALAALLAEAEAEDQIKIDRAIEKRVDFVDAGEHAGQWERERRSWEERDGSAARLVAALTALTRAGEEYSAEPVTMSVAALNWLLQLRLKSSPQGCAALR